MLSYSLGVVVSGERRHTGDPQRIADGDKDVQAILRSRLQQAYAGGFGLLRRIPNTTAWRTLGHLQSLSAADRLAAFDTCAEIATENIEFALELGTPTAAATGSATAKSPRAVLFDEVFSVQDWSAFPDRFMRQFNLDAAGLARMVEPSRVESILACPPSVVAKAGAIRKTLHGYLKTHHQAEFQNRGGGVWACIGRVADKPFALSLDYGGRGSGFSYGVQFPRHAEIDYQGNALTLESCYGFPSGRWDFPLADELPRLCETLTQVISELQAIHDAILEADRTSSP
ncbi:hypothetical protein UC8_21670 [Roseimaritima ulvae]|uniref:Uncharacterized protein n=1 Tax=Roseimaritima ulvae TaxID=980254 RepID=A0A5B9R1S1_9BACT|nr:hypothetical protein UC8_21670 [Roseimaritima ulvae]